jgi:SCY1-like protein 1
MGNAFPFASDIWSFACVLYTIFHENSFLSSNLLSNASNLPSALQTHFRQALDQDPFKRPSPEKFLTSNFFNTLFIQRMDFLENLAIKNSEEKIEYFKELYANLDSLPCCFGRHKILPALKNVVDFTSTNTSIKLDSSASFMLPIIVQIGSLQLNDEEFKIQVVPLLVKFFTCPDRAVRVQLLQKMEKFVVHFDTKLINSEMIFDNICTGFTDASPVLRELTVKSILHFADKLSESNLNTKIMKFFAKLLQDPEPAIRTNTTICLGRLASQLNVKTRSKILFPAFSKAMKDSFPHARLAGLRSMTACEEFFEPMICASNILPCISPLLLDTSMLVREQASVSIQIFMKKINEEAKQMKIKEEEQAKEDKMKQQELQQQASAALSPSGASGALSASRMESVTGYASSLTSWASSKLVGSGPITPVSSSTTPSASTGTHASTTTINTTTSSNSTDSMNSLASIGGSNAADVFAMGGGDVADAWGEDDDLDLVNSPQPSGAKKTTTTRSRTNDASEWGDDLDLDFEDSSTVPTPSKVTSSSSVTPTFGSYNSISNSSISLGGQNNHRTATETATATTVGPSSDSTTIHTTSTTTNRLGAMKLETTKKITEANEWDNWDF